MNRKQNDGKFIGWPILKWMVLSDCVAQTDWITFGWAMIYRLVCWSWHLVWIKLNYTLSRLCWQDCSYLYVMKEWKKKQSVVIVLHLVCLFNETENCGKKNGSIITAHICSISILLLHVETNSSFFINELHVKVVNSDLF